MSPLESIPEDVLELLQAACEGTLSDQQQARLDALMAADQQVARHYAQWFDMHAELYFLARIRRARHKALAEIAGGHAQGKADFANARPADASTESATPIAVASRSSVMRDWVRGFRREPAALAILILAMISGGLLIWQLSNHSPVEDKIANQASGGRKPPVSARTEVGIGKSELGVQGPRHQVARLVRTAGAVWRQTDAPAANATLSAGQKLSLQSGLAEITFNSGATVILEGPAEFVVGAEGSGIRSQGSEERSDNACSLSLGKLVANVPHQAHGFTVQTPAMKIVDLGTEFGVTVQAAKNLTPDLRPLTPALTEVQVFQGEVRVTPITIALAQAGEPEIGDAAKSQILKAGEAIKSEPAGTAPRVTKADPNMFVRQLPPEAVTVGAKQKDTGWKPMLRPGDILAVTRNTLKLVKIDPKTGEQTVLVQGNPDRHGTDWMCVAVDARGQVFVGADRGPDQGGQVLRIDPRDRSIQIVASDGRLANKRVNGLTIAHDGQLYAALDGPQEDEVVRIDPRSGAVSAVATWGNNIWGIAPDTQGGGLIAVSDYLGSVARIDGQTVTLWTRDSGTHGAHGVVVRPDGRVFVSATTDGDRRCKILEVDRATHRVTEIVGMPMQYQWTLGMLAVEADGRLIVGNGAPTSKVYRVDVDARTIVPLAEGKHLERVWGVAVMPGEPVEKK